MVYYKKDIEKLPDDTANSFSSLLIIANISIICCSFPFNISLTWSFGVPKSGF